MNLNFFMIFQKYPNAHAKVKILHADVHFPGNSFDFKALQSELIFIRWVQNPKNTEFNLTMSPWIRSKSDLDPILNRIKSLSTFYEPQHLISQFYYVDFELE